MNLFPPSFLSDLRLNMVIIPEKGSRTGIKLHIGDPAT